MKRMLRVLVTGAKGFVGKHLCEKLKADRIFSAKCIDIDDFDLTEWGKVEKIAPFDIVIHLAALSFVPEAFLRPRVFYETNFLATLHTLELCRKYDAKIIYASSYVYGKPQYLPIDEEHPVSAYNPYAETKLLGEALCRAYYRDFGVRYAIVRPSNIYGEGADKKFLIPTIIEQINKGEVRLKSSSPKRDFIHVDDVSDIYLRLCKYDFDELVLNAGSGKSFSVKEVVNMILKLKGVDLPVYYEEELRRNEVLNVVYDIHKAKKMLNWEPKISLEEGLRKLL